MANQKTDPANADNQKSSQQQGGNPGARHGDDSQADRGTESGGGGDRRDGNESDGAERSNNPNRVDRDGDRRGEGDRNHAG